jgi:glycosyltransferase involved in cell wall biosynthesis
MHVWFVVQGEPLPFQQGMRLLRYGELTRVMARRGHQVTWWANDFSHSPRGYIGEPNARVKHDGIELVLVHGSGYARNISFARFKHVAVHGKNLARLTADAPPPDIIVCAMPTIEAAEVMAHYGQIHATPVIIDNRDEWPEDYVRAVPKPLRPLARLVLRPRFQSLRRACSAATALCAVTEAQLAYGLRHAGRLRQADDRVFYSGARITPPPRPLVEAEIAKWRGMGIQDSDFTCVFIGSMSPLRPLSAIIEVVKRLSEQIPIKLVLAGKGDREAVYRRQAAGHPNILLPGWINTVQMTALSEIAGVMLAPYKSGHGFSMPVKIFDYLAAGRPLLSSCLGEAERLIRDQRVGLQIDAEDGASIEDALLQLYCDPVRRREMGAKARSLFEENFTMEGIMERYADHIEQLAGKVACGP